MNKQKLSVAIIFIFSMFLITSCTDEPLDPVLAAQIAANNSSSGGNSSAGTFTASVDGSNFSANSIIANMVNNPITGNTLNVIGLSSSGEYISITLVAPAVGTFSANSSSDPTHPAILSYQQSSSSSDVYTANDASFQPTGSISVSSFNSTSKIISGTFHFDGYLSSGSGNIKHITNGIFNNINYIAQ
jgi:hypothetical protein